MSCIETSITDIGAHKTSVVFFNKAIVIFLIGAASRNDGMLAFISLELQEMRVQKFGAIIRVYLQDRRVFGLECA